MMALIKGRALHCHPLLKACGCEVDPIFEDILLGGLL